jgi:Ca-activated chloride channel family protein
VTEGFHFSEPLWLWAFLVPLLLWLIPRMRRSDTDESRLAAYADAHLLPHLVLGGRDRRPSQRRRFLWWSLLWLLAILAMSGPRWDFTDVAVSRPGNNLVILLDLSRSMDVTDERPTRLGRARQEIEDLLDQNQGAKVGRVAFASVAHVVSPITEDGETLRHLLPSLSSDLVRFPGSRLTQALARAERLLGAQPESEPGSILIISDGDFAEQDLVPQIVALRDVGIPVHVLGIGTPDGGVVPLSPMAGATFGNRGPVISRLEEERLQALAEAGGGIYRRADYLEDDTRDIWERVLSDSQLESPVGETAKRVWHERYPLLVALAMLIVLLWFRRGAEPGRAVNG